jgi:hypothetical protein
LSTSPSSSSFARGDMIVSTIFVEVDAIFSCTMGYGMIELWKNFDLMYPEFAKETKNVRFALGTDGMNLFSEKISVHSTWPVTLTMYNLPSWLCHKRKYIMLTILIQGPKSAGVDINVFLEPLMEDMTKL